jgi:hypothetical protein
VTVSANSTPPGDAMSIAIPSEQREPRGPFFVVRQPRQEAIPPRRIPPEFFGFALHSTAMLRAPHSGVILNRPGEGRVKDLSSAFAEVSRAKICPRQIATKSQTKTSVTYSKQRIGLLPNRYKIDNSFVVSFLPPFSIISSNFTRPSISFGHTDEARRGVFARAVLPFPHADFCDPCGIRGEWR